MTVPTQEKIPITRDALRRHIVEAIRKIPSCGDLREEDIQIHSAIGPQHTCMIGQLRTADAALCDPDKARNALDALIDEFKERYRLTD
jgi:hypothetical protein